MSAGDFEKPILLQASSEEKKILITLPEDFSSLGEAHKDNMIKVLITAIISAIERFK